MSDTRHPLTRLTSQLPVPVRRILFPAQQLIRDVRQPTRSRNQAVRRGMSLDALGAPSRSLPVWIRGLGGLPDRKGPIWGVVMAKNEQVRLPGAVRHLLEQGVDAILVANNGSTDETAELMREMGRSEPIICVDDNEPGLYHARKVTRMARAAARRGAAWIVPFDADELWYGVGDSLKNCLQNATGDIVAGKMYDHLPEVGLGETADPYREVTRRCSTPGPNKVAFRAHVLASVHQGNHWVNLPGSVERGRIEVRHFPFLGFAHFERKAKITAEALRKTDFERGNASYILEWDAMDDEALRAEWSRLVGRSDTVVDPAPLGPGVVGNVTRS